METYSKSLVLSPACKEFIHFFQEGIIFNNMELSNILLDGSGHVVLADRTSKEFEPHKKVNFKCVLSVGQCSYSNK
jgi:hypothetical protein